MSKVIKIDKEKQAENVKKTLGSTKPIEQQFMDEYNKLCNKYKLSLAASPIFVETNHSSFEIGIQYNLRKKK